MWGPHIVIGLGFADLFGVAIETNVLAQWLAVAVGSMLFVTIPYYNILYLD